MDVSLLFAFWGTAVLLIAVPGPDWAFTLGSSIRDNTVLPAVTGLMLGYAALTVVIAAGVGALVASNPAVLTALTAVGAGYLVYLGSTLLARPGVLDASTADAPHTGGPWWRKTLRGVAVSGLNPKGLLIFLAMLPQFTDPAGSWSFAVQIGALGLLFVASCGTFYLLLGLGARTVLRTRPAASRALSRFSGLALLAVGVALLAERAFELAP